jgi:glutamine phosphoribosylpyrophosphate amidotransferase
MVNGCMLVGFRDAYGLKPLTLGKRQAEGGSTSYIIASESIALEKLGYSIVRDIEPGWFGRIARNSLILTAEQAKPLLSIKAAGSNATALTGSLP